MRTFFMSQGLHNIDNRDYTIPRDNPKQSEKDKGTTTEIFTLSSDHKRKLEDLEGEEVKNKGEISCLARRSQRPSKRPRSLRNNHLLRKTVALKKSDHEVCNFIIMEQES